MTFFQLILRVLLVAVIAAGAATAAYLISAEQPKRYQATTRVLLTPTVPELEAIGYRFDFGDEKRRIVNNVYEVRSYEVALRTAQVLDDPYFTADRIASSVSAYPERESDVVTITAVGRTPAEAAMLVKEYRREFTFRRQEAVRARARRAARALRASLRALPERSRRSGAGDALRHQLGALAIFIETGGDPFILEGVRAYASPVTPKTQRNTLFGALFGAVLGVGLVALRDATRPSRRAQEQGTVPAPA